MLYLIICSFHFFNKKQQIQEQLKEHRSLNHCRIKALCNQHQSYLPTTDYVGDLLRDDDTLIVEVNSTRDFNFNEDEDDAEDDEVDENFKPPVIAYDDIPAPMELTEAEVIARAEQIAEENQNAAAAGGETGEAAAREGSGGKTPSLGTLSASLADSETRKRIFGEFGDVPFDKADWMVDNLSPKFKEYVVARFRESTFGAKHPYALQEQETMSGAWISVFVESNMSKKNPDAPPMMYNLARVDVIEFERMCKRNIDQSRHQAKALTKKMTSLQSRLDKGAEPQTMVPVVFPYLVKKGGAAATVEEEGPILGSVEGFRPIFIIDTGGAMARNMDYLRSSMKRLLYTYVVMKSKFTFITFDKNGRAKAWTNDMLPTGSNILREAEVYIDELRPRRNHGNILDAMRLATSFAECDVLFHVCAGVELVNDTRLLRRQLKTVNAAEIPVHLNFNIYSN